VPLSSTARDRGKEGLPRDETKTLRNDMLATVAIVGTLLAVIAAQPLLRRLSKHPTPEHCIAMLERYADYEARAKHLDPPLRSSRAPASATPPPEVGRCVKELTAFEVDCALKSTNVDEIERCLP
jgi:hypothetical protein